MIEVYAPQGVGFVQLSSTKFWVDVYDGDTETYLSAYTFGRARKSIAAYGTTGAETPRTKLWVSGSSPEVSFLTFGASAETTVKITKLNEPITDIKLRPASKNFEYSVTGGNAYIQMSPNDKVWATVNNETSSPIFIFCNNFKDVAPTAACLYFGPGIHHVSSLAPTGTPGQLTNHVRRLFETTSVGVSAYLSGINFSSFEHYGYVEGQPFTIYLDGGAYVIGTFDLRNRHNITIKGPGILSVENAPKEFVETLKDHDQTPYPAFRDMGLIPLWANSEYDQLTSSFPQVTLGPTTYGPFTLYSVDKMPSGMVVKDITIIDTPGYIIRGLNIAENVKILSPWAYNSDGIYLLPDSSTKSCVAKDCFLFTADDCIYSHGNDGGGPSFQNFINSLATVNPLYLKARVGSTGTTTVSGCQFYSTNNGPLLVAYYPFFYYNDPALDSSAWSVPILYYDCDIGSYSVNRQNAETCIRICTDGSSVNRTTSAGLYAFDTNLTFSSWGLRNITLSDIRVEDPIDTELFWIGNIPDPFADNPADPQLGDRGNEFGFISGVILKDITVSGSDYNTSAIYNNRIWGRDASSRPSDITLENIKINNIYITDTNKNNFISWASGSNPTYTNPDTYSSDIVFLFSLPYEQGFVTNNGIKVDYLWDRGQLHPFVATLHYIQEQAKILQASAYYDDNLDEYSQDNWWKNNLQSYANSSTELSGAFPNSFDNYTTYRFGRDFHKLYYDYTHNFKRHRAIPTTTILDGPTIFGHTFGSIFYNSKLKENGSFTNSFPQYITSSLANVQELVAYSIPFSTSGSLSGCYVASTTNDVLIHTDGGTRIPEFRNSGILSHVEFIHPSGASVNNSFAVIRLDKSNRLGYRYNPLLHENTLIKQKSRNSASRFAFDITKYSLDSGLGYDVSTNFLTPEHDYKLNLKSLISTYNGEILGGDSICVWIHTKPERGKIWSFTKDKVWVQHSLLDVKQTNLIDSYCHKFDIPEQQRNLDSSNIRCSRFRIVENQNRENDVIASLAETDFNNLELIFNTKNKFCNGGQQAIEVPVDYFDNVANQVHRLNQNYVIEIFSNCKDINKFTLFYDINLMDVTLNKWSKPFITGKPNGSTVGDTYCKEYRVDLSRNHLLTIIKYFNEIAGAYNSFGYASRDQIQTSGVYEARGGSRINYVESPEWSSNTKSSGGNFIRSIDLNN